MRQTILVVLCVTLAACATESHFREQAQARIGQDANDVIREKGPPDTEYDMPNGNRVLTWVRYGQTVSWAGAMISGVGSGLTGQENLGARPRATACAVSYEIDRSTTRVVSFRYEGNGCKSR